MVVGWCENLLFSEKKETTLGFHLGPILVLVYPQKEDLRKMNNETNYVYFRNIRGHTQSTHTCSKNGDSLERKTDRSDYLTL